MANRLGRALAYVVDAVRYALTDNSKARGLAFSDTLGTMARVSQYQFEDSAKSESALRLAIVSAWVYSDIRLIADRASSKGALPEVFRVVDEETEEIKDHPFERLLVKPNSLMTGSYLYRYLVWWYELLGNAYVFIGTPSVGRGEPMELWPLPANQVRPKLDSLHASRLTGKPIIDYEQLVGGEWRVLPGENVVHFRTPNPMDYWQGLAPISAANLGLQIDYSQSSWLRDFFREDNAIPTAIASLPPTTSKIDFETTVTRIREQLEEGMRILFTRSGDLTLQTITQTLEQMQIVQARVFNREEIDRVYGVPQGLVSGGLSGDSRIAAEITFARNTVQPLIDYFAAEWTAKIGPYYGDDIVVEAPNVIPQDRALEVQEYNVYSRDRTINENRQELSLARIEMPEADIPVRLLPFLLGPAGAMREAGGGLGSFGGQQSPESVVAGNAGKTFGGNGHGPAVDEGIRAELKRWQKVALKEAAAGRDPAARPFESAIIPEAMRQRVVQALAGADAEQVKKVFANVSSDNHAEKAIEAPLMERASRFRRALIDREDAAARSMARAWEQSWQRIADKVPALVEQVREAQASGQVIAGEVIFQMERYKALMEQVESQLAALAPDFDLTIQKAQREALEQAIADARGLVQSAIPFDEDVQARIEAAWNRLPVEAVEDLVGVLQDGSPLVDVLRRYGDEVSAGLSDELVAGLVEGINPRDIAQRMHDRFAVALQKAEVLARTEILRAYRTATLQNYQANSHLIQGWQWHAHLGDDRVCIACAMLHGSLHPADEPMNSHPQCRCTAIPVMRPLAEIGIEGVEDLEPPIHEGDGLRWFESLTPEEQEQLLGGPMYQAWQAGAITPDQFYRWHHDDVWGDAPQPANVRQLLGAGAAEFYEEA